MADPVTTSYAYPLIFAALGGILPALVWLWFWTQEDKLHPEPRMRLLLAFWGGMVAVALTYPVEKAIAGYFGMTGVTFFLWAIVEEVLKLAMVWFTALRTKVYDEPIDALEYLITTALGFAALENTLFILNPLLEGRIFDGLATGNMRFLGASLLHVVCSAIIGYAIGREFYQKTVWKRSLWLLGGLGVAIGLHTLFNLFILYENGSKTFLVFSCVWIAAIGILLLFEKIKKVQQ